MSKLKTSENSTKNAPFTTHFSHFQTFQCHKTASTSIFFIVINKLMKVFIEIESNKVSQEYHLKIYYKSFSCTKNSKIIPFHFPLSFISIASYSLYPFLTIDSINLHLQTHSSTNSENYCIILVSP